MSTMTQTLTQVQAEARVEAIVSGVNAAALERKAAPRRQDVYDDAVESVGGRELTEAESDRVFEADLVEMFDVELDPYEAAKNAVFHGLADAGLMEDYHNEFGDYDYIVEDYTRYTVSAKLDAPSPLTQKQAEQRAEEIADRIVSSLYQHKGAKRYGDLLDDKRESVGGRELTEKETEEVFAIDPVIHFDIQLDPDEAAQRALTAAYAEAGLMDDTRNADLDEYDTGNPYDSVALDGTLITQATYYSRNSDGSWREYPANPTRQNPKYYETEPQTAMPPRPDRVASYPTAVCGARCADGSSCRRRVAAGGKCPIH